MLNLTRYSRENPIATKLLGLIVLSSSIITLIAIFLQLYAGFSDDIAALEKRLDQVRISTLPSITKSLWGFDEEQLKVQIQSVLEVKDVAQVTVIWRDWNNTEQAIIASSTTIDVDKLKDSENAVLIKEYPLLYSDLNTPEQKLGNLVITASLDGVYNKLWERAWFIATLQGTKTIIVSLLILWLVRTLLTRHMETIAHYARQLTLDNLTTPLQLNRNKSAQDSLDELDNVVQGFNQMRETLVEDIRRRNEVEMALLAEKEEKLETRKQKIAAESANRAKSQFLATMSHEIRTPMNGVIGMVEMLRDTPLNETQQHYLDIIHRSGEALVDVINDILDYSKIEAGKMELETADFNLEELIDDCSQLFAITASKRQIELVSSVNPNTPLRLKGDPTRIRQILINLLGNAFKFTSSGYVFLEIKEESNNYPGHSLIHFSIKDTGVGIAKKSQGALFNSFQQADSSTTRKYGGTGLGLAICKRLAEMMNGEIGLESEEGKGSVFWFTARLEISKQESLPDIHSKNIASAIANTKLLLVEKSALLCEVVTRQCNSWEVKTTCTPSGQQALEMLTQSIKDNNHYDFVCLNHKLIDTDGLELAREIGKQPGINDLKLLMLANSNTVLNEETIADYGIQTVLQKPVSFKQLKFKLANLKQSNLKSLKESKPSDKYHDAFSHIRVLVAEDNAVNRIVIVGLLSKFNIKPIVVENGLQALEAFTTSKEAFDAILMDCEMPEMDGFEATRRIREYESQHNLPAISIIALTAHAMQEHREAVFAAGMSYYLSKPVTMNGLSEAFEQLMPKPAPAPAPSPDIAPIRS